MNQSLDQTNSLGSAEKIATLREAATKALVSLKGTLCEIPEACKEQLDIITNTQLSVAEVLMSDNGLQNAAICDDILAVRVVYTGISELDNKQPDPGLDPMAHDAQGTLLATKRVAVEILTPLLEAIAEPEMA